MVKIEKIINFKCFAHYSLHRFCLTNYTTENGTRPIAFVCFESAETFEAEAQMFVIKGIMLLISVIFLMATLYVYKMIPDMRETQVKHIYYRFNQQQINSL